MYVGGFERNFRNLTPGTTTFEGTDGQSHPYPEWPAGVDGLRISYMEKSGKKFVAVRVADDMSDVVLVNEMVMVPGEHFGFGARLSGEPTLVEDNIDECILCGLCLDIGPQGAVSIYKLYENDAQLLKV